MEIFNKLIDWVKLQPRYLLPIGIATGFLLFSPNNILQTLGLESLMNEYRGWFGIVFVFIAGLLLSHFFLRIYSYLTNLQKERESKKNREWYIQQLTPKEKAILSGYIVNDTKTQYLRISDGVVNGLTMAGIIFRASQVGYDHGWAYNIQPWAWTYLKQNPEYLV